MDYIPYRGGQFWQLFPIDIRETCSLDLRMDMWQSLMVGNDWKLIQKLQ